MLQREKEREKERESERKRERERERERGGTREVMEEWRKRNTDGPKKLPNFQIFLIPSMCFFKSP